MKFTGERYMPGLSYAQISYEHWHRYMFTKYFIADKVVADIACGEGYGSFYMAQFAKQVIGIDVDSEAVEYAQSNYKKDNLQYIQSNAAAINIDQEHFVDVIISFETIEHLTEEEQHLFLKEAKRLLKPDGKLLISTPDKYGYSDIPQYKNEFHLKEFYSDEFQKFLETYFEHTLFLKQRIFPGSFIWNDSLQNLEPCFIDFIDNRYVIKETFSGNPLYFIGICSNEVFKFEQSSVLVDGSSALLNEYENSIKHWVSNTQQLENELLKVKDELNKLQAEYTKLKNTITIETLNSK